MKPGYSFDNEMDKALQNLDRHARGLTHATETIKRLRESSNLRSGSEPTAPTPQNERAAESKNDGSESENQPPQ